MQLLFVADLCGHKFDVPGQQLRTEQGGKTGQYSAVELLGELVLVIEFVYYVNINKKPQTKKSEVTYFQKVINNLYIKG